MPCGHKCKNKATCGHQCCKAAAAAASPNAPEHVLRRFSLWLIRKSRYFAVVIALALLAPHFAGSALKYFGGQAGEIPLPSNPCVAEPEFQLFNRKQEAQLLRSLIEDTPILTISGPPSSGKSTWIPRVIANLSNGAPIFCINLRAKGIRDYDTLVHAFRTSMVASSTWATTISKLSTLSTNVANADFDQQMTKLYPWWPAVNLTANALIAFGENTDESQLNDPAKIIHAWKTAIERYSTDTKKKVIIYIDELNIAKGGTGLTPEERGKMKEFIEALERMFITVTKEHKWALVVQITSDQVMQQQLSPLRLNTAGFGEFATLGYMAKGEVLEFLKHSGINNESLRLDIFNFAGG